MNKEKLVKLADIVRGTVERGLKHINYGHITLGVIEGDEVIDIGDEEGSFALRVTPENIAIQIYTCGTRMPEVHIKESFDVEEDDLDDDDVPGFVYDVVAWLLGEYVKYNIQMLGYELLGGHND